MPVAARDLAELQQQAAEIGDVNGDRLAGLASVAQVIAFVHREALEDGADAEGALDRVELLCRFSELSPGEVREAAATLSRIGYTALSKRLREIAGRRTATLKPLQ